MNDLRIWAAGLAAAALTTGPAAHAAPPAADPTFGEWLTATGDGKVRVGPCAANPAQACGTLVWAKPPADAPPGPNIVKTVSNERITPLFTATVEATEEAIVNAMVGAKTMTGIEGHTVVALPHEQLNKVLKKYNR